MEPGALNLSTKVIGHGRLLFVHLDGARADAELRRAVGALGAHLENMHFAEGAPADEAARRGRYQYLRAAVGHGGPREVSDPGISGAGALIRLEGRDAEPLRAYEDGLRLLIAARGGAVHARSGVARERSYTSHAMTQFAYAHAFGPRTGARCPWGVVTPQNKTAEWWAMDWMRRETLFLPRYDASGRMEAEGHALASAAGVPCITRRLLHNGAGYGTGDGYDFLGYFEFAEADAPTFRAVMAALRDHARNPEWAYVREGPEWWGRRVGDPSELW